MNSSFIKLDTGEGISLYDIMPDIRQAIAKLEINNGFVTVTSQQTRTAIVINGHEERLLQDVKILLTRLVPPYNHYHFLR